MALEVRVGLGSVQASEPTRPWAPHIHRSTTLMARVRGSVEFGRPDPVCVLNMTSCSPGFEAEVQQCLFPSRSAQQGLDASFRSLPTATPTSSQPCLCQPLKCFPWFFFCPQDCSQSLTSSPHHPPLPKN